MPYFPFSPFEPDNALLNEDASKLTLNVLPGTGGFDSCPSLVSLLPSLPEPCVTIAAFSENNESFIFAASQTAIYRLITGQWVNVSRQGAGSNPYHVFGEYGWNFISFQQTPMATGDGERPQIWDFALQRFRNVDNTWQKPNPTDAITIQPVPYARTICCNNEFVFLLAADEKLSRMYWSGTRQPEVWQTGQQASSYNDFDVGGEVMFVSQGTSPIILLRKGIYQARRADVAGAFSLVKIATGLGCFYYNSAASLNDTTYFLDEYGFFSISDGGQLTPIGFNKVNNWIREVLTVHVPQCRISCFADERNMRIYWNFYPKKAPLPPQPDYPRGEDYAPFALVYDVLRDQWSKLTHGGMSACSVPWRAFSLDELSAGLGNNDPSLDTTLYFFSGFVPAFLSADGLQVLLQAGKSEEALLQASWQGNTNQSMGLVNKIQPIIENPDFDALCRLKMDLTAGHQPFYTPWARQSRIDGAFRICARARTAKVQLKLPYGSKWTKAQGIDMDIKPAGAR